MGYPKGLSWENGYATDGFYHYVLCQKAGHKRFFKCTKIKEDALQALNDHRALFHSTLGDKVMEAVSKLTEQEEGIITIREVLDRFERRVRSEVKRGDLTRGTEEFYAYSLTALRNNLPLDVPAKDLKRRDAKAYEERRRSHGQTRGACIRKELATLIRACKAEDIVLPFDVKDLNIKAAKRQRRKLTIADAMRWIGCMREPERSLCLMKLWSGGDRNVELFEQTVGRVNFERGGWTITLHAKRGTYEHWQDLPPEALSLLRQLCEGKNPDDLLFRLPRGGRMNHRNIRAELERASNLAGINPPLRSIGFLRHAAITLLLNKLGDVRAVQKHIGHRHQSTTEIYDREELFAELGLERKAKSAEAARALASGFVLPSTVDMLGGDSPESAPN